MTCKLVDAADSVRNTDVYGRSNEEWIKGQL